MKPIDRVTVATMTVEQAVNLLAEHHQLAPKLLRHLGVARHALQQISAACVRDGRISLDTLALIEGYTGPGHRQVLCEAVSDLAKYAMWRQHRIAIPFDPDLFDELGETADRDIVSAQMFKFLPLANPYLHFPKPIVMPTADPGRQQAIIGAYVLGLRRETIPDGSGNCPDVVCATDDPRMYTLTLKFAGVLTSAQGVPLRIRPQWSQQLAIPDMVWTISPLMFDRPEMTFGELAAISIERFDHDTDAGLGVQPSLGLVAMQRRAIACLMYLCCTNADLRVRKQARKGKRRPSKDRQLPPTIVDAGLAVGAALRRWRYERDESEAAQPTGATVRPHPRRAHLQRFRYGKGRTQLSAWRYVPMVWVNASRDNKKTVTVRKARRD